MRVVENTPHKASEPVVSDASRDWHEPKINPKYGSKVLFTGLMPSTGLRMTDDPSPFKCV